MKSGNIKWLKTNTRFAFGPIIFLSFLNIIVSYISMRFAFVSKDVLDIATGAHPGSLKTSLFILCALISSYIIIHIIYSVIDVKLSCVVTNRISNKLYKRIITSDYPKISKYHSGELVNRLNGDVSVITAGLMGIIPSLVQMSTKAVFSFVALYMLDKNFALLCIVILPFVTIASRIYGKRMKKLHKKSRWASGRVYSHMQEGIRNILILKAFVKEAASSKKLSQLQDESMKLNVKAGIISMIANLLFFAVMTFGYYCALIWCAYKISIGLMTVGTLTAILQLFSQLQTPFEEFSAIIPLYYKTTASVERIRELEEIQQEDTDKNIVCRDFTSIVAKDLSFGYEEDEPVLSNFNAEIQKGKMTVLGGDSGSGKSTFIKLMMGVLHPDSGSIYFLSDEGDKVDCDYHARVNFAYVPQGNMILSGTIKSNIAFYNEEISEQTMIQSAKDACIYDYIMSLPDGFDTILGEGGLGLSEGQIQRLAIARALSTNANVLILDEATSALDEQTEENVLCNIKNRTDLTTLVISHRKCAFELADKVLHIQ